MTSVLVVGTLVAFLVTTVVAAYQRAPTRLYCPRCGGDTDPVQAPFWLAQSAPKLVGRWCPACGWEGVGRVGADGVPGRPMAHDSGFLWGDERLPEDLGFEFATPPEQTAEREPPHHPSGFRFAGSEPTRAPAHPSGFDWGGRARPPLFRWKRTSAEPGGSATSPSEGRDRPSRR